MDTRSAFLRPGAGKRNGLAQPARLPCALAQGNAMAWRSQDTVAERAGFEPAEEREPLAGLANRCLGPLDYLSEEAFYRPGNEFAKGEH